MPIKSDFPDVELAVTDIWSFLFNRKDREYPDSHVIFQSADTLSRQYTFAQLRQSSVDFAKGLKAVYEFRKGDVLGLFVPNDIDVPPVVLGTLWAGAIVSPANPGYTVAEMVYQLKDSGTKALCTHFSVLDTARKAAREAGIPESNIFLLGEKQKDASVKIKHWTSIRNLDGTQRFRKPKLDPKTDLAFLVYSSGTTGRPKGVRLTHFNMTSNIEQTHSAEGWLTWNGTSTPPNSDIPLPARGTGDKILACLPFFHIYGLNCLVLSPIYSGVHTMVMARFDLERWCSIVQDHKITFSYIVPPIVLLLCKHPVVEKYDLSSLRMTNSGAAPLTRELVEGLYARKGVKVKQGYGLSETAPTIFMQKWEEWRSAIGTTGVMVTNLEAKFCAVPGSGEESDGRKELPRGEIGELYVRGPNVFSGYHNNPSATAECLEDGWFRTGDVGFLDERGNLTITDRVKELIKYKGFQVPPAELEGYLASHPLVDDVAVVGVDSQTLGTEVPRAYIVRKGGLSAVKPTDAAEIMAWMNAKVANHKKLRGGVKFVDAVPKSVSGKILRRILKERAKAEFREEEQEQDASRAKAKVKAKL
ncbi:putative 4-coumarate--CoA ligase 1 [Cladophialophora carrionii]|uniref:Putative 4-coumarate--CoA ligase 1 n=1 Tax=Cladophialophora carrionii TaxID=86049 RepID=A0A1C1CDQ6_9EURO|nr:putative 4-coumarate--CoA ligase 1 [Cladophialophora carrionii]